MTTEAITPLRQRMIEDMKARKLCAGTQRGHILSCKRFAAFLKRSPDTANLEDIRRFQLHLAETDMSICNRNRIMTGLRFLLRVTLRRLDLAEEVYHIREPQKLPAVMSVDEIKRLLAATSCLKTRVLLSLGYGCGLRAKHLGARIGILSVLHTWGSAMTHHPHVHMIVPGGGFSLDGKRWVACRPRFFLAVEVLSALFRGLFLAKLRAAYRAGELQFFGKHARLIDPRAFAAYLAPLWNTNWVVYCKRPFGGPKQVLRYLARYTHRVAISNRRLIACDQKGVAFKWKDYRLEGRERYKRMTLATDEFIRRFLMHVLPAGFHRIRYYGLLASGKRADNIARARELLTPPMIAVDAIKAANTNADQPQTPEHRCPCCGGRMVIIERFERGSTPHYQPTPPTPVIRIDTS